MNHDFIFKPVSDMSLKIDHILISFSKGSFRLPTFVLRITTDHCVEMQCFYLCGNKDLPQSPQHIATCLNEPLYWLRLAPRGNEHRAFIFKSENALSWNNNEFQVYHKPPTSFVEGHGGLKRALPSRGASDMPQAQVIPGTNTIKPFPWPVNYGSFWCTFKFAP